MLQKYSSNRHAKSVRDTQFSKLKNSEKQMRLSFYIRVCQVVFEVLKSCEKLSGEKKWSKKLLYYSWWIFSRSSKSSTWLRWKNKKLCWFPILSHKDGLELIPVGFFFAFGNRRLFLHELENDQYLTVLKKHAEINFSSTWCALGNSFFYLTFLRDLFWRSLS